MKNPLSKTIKKIKKKDSRNLRDNLLQMKQDLDSNNKMQTKIREEPKVLMLRSKIKKEVNFCFKTDFQTNFFKTNSWLNRKQ